MAPGVRSSAKTGEVLFAGGEYTGAPAGTADLYNIKQRTWTTAATLLAPRSRAVCALLPNGRALVAGGMGNPDRRRVC